MRLEVDYHGNCFDGCASAALVSRFLRERARIAAVRFVPLSHGQGSVFPADAFAGDLNACVDFRYSPSPRLHWWFDHHASAFPTPEDRAAFEGDRSGQKFWDPKAPSCAGFIARTLDARFGWRPDGLGELVRWADVIDAAAFESPAQAVELAEPALRIMTLLEATRDPAIPTRIIEAMAEARPLAEIVAAPWAAEPLAPILERHHRAIDVVRSLARIDGGVVTFDLSGTGIESANKFLSYFLFPDAAYTVVVTRDAKRSKVSVGSNPWARPARPHDISKLCERYGGGGHPVVGAVSLPPDRLDDARRVAAEIATTLRTPPPP
ncbi:MAG TPA: DHH family phosphoesterase [Anaeromyxobacteraceae bacterium]|nr:DHH family phosphoesterase [Anaeromyxobacteraceae bacterium]